MEQNREPGNNPCVYVPLLYDFPGSLVGKNPQSACNAGDRGDTGLIPGSGRSPGGCNGNLFQYSCLGNPMDRGAWSATVHGVARESDMTEHARIHCMTKREKIHSGEKTASSISSTGKTGQLDTKE